MNIRRIAVGAWILFAFVGGYHLGLRLTLLEEAKKAFVGIQDTQHLAAVISAATLKRLESGDTEGAKRLLATNLSGYHRADRKVAPSPQQITLRQEIEKMSEQSPTLRQMLAIPPP
jgi:hypothetical protein